MSGRQIKGAAVLLVVAIVALAWFDAGEEPLHPIEQAVDLPEGAR